jgi:hypothetical protein
MARIPLFILGGLLSKDPREENLTGVESPVSFI